MQQAAEAVGAHHNQIHLLLRSRIQEQIGNFIAATLQNSRFMRHFARIQYAGCVCQHFFAGLFHRAAQGQAVAEFGSAPVKLRQINHMHRIHRSAYCLCHVAGFFQCAQCRFAVIYRHHDFLIHSILLVSHTNGFVWFDLRLT